MLAFWQLGKQSKLTLVSRWGINNASCMDTKLSLLCIPNGQRAKVRDLISALYSPILLT